MVKIFLDETKMKKAEKKHDLQDVKKYLAENNLCYVLLTCSVPKDDGNMQVDMVYEGDEAVASYLIENAQDIVKGKEPVSSDNN